jgi:hypothetical protein
MREQTGSNYPDTKLDSSCSRNFSHLEGETKIKEKFLGMPRNKLGYYGIYGFAIICLVALTLGL